MILRKKCKLDRILDKYKVRLVAKCFIRKEGIDYEEIYSPVAKFTSIRIIMVIVVHLDLELHQIYVKTTFLNSELKEEIYMRQLEGYEILNENNKVHKLNKSLYGRKQSSRQLYYKFHDTLISFSLVSNDFDYCGYMKNGGSSIMSLSLYVDDISLASNDLKMLNKIKVLLKSQFEIKDMGEASFVLGIKIIGDRKIKKLSLS